jgi:hypothetical protein
MHSPLQHENEIVRYLLGEMEEPELLAIENRLMADSDFFAEVRAFEDELIDSYLNGELSAAQERRFREHFLRVPKRQQQLQFAQALRKHLRDNMATRPPGGFGARSRSAFLWVSAALLILCAVEGAFAWRFLADLRREEQHGAELNRKLQATVEEREREKRNSLISSAVHIVPLQPVTRDSGKNIRRDTTPMFLELQLPAGEPGSSFNVEIQDQHGKIVTRFENVPVGVVDTTRVVFVPLSPEGISEGDFNLLLQNSAAAPSNAAPLRYSFHLVRP